MTQTDFVLKSSKSIIKTEITPIKEFLTINQNSNSRTNANAFLGTTNTSTIIPNKLIIKNDEKEDKPQGKEISL